MTASWDLCAGIMAYVIASLGGVAMVKYLNYHDWPGICWTSSWLVVALLSRATWLLAWPVLAWQLRHVASDNVYGICTATIHRVTFVQLRIYLWVAVGLSIVEALNAISLTVLPGSLYALIKGTDVAWSMILSYLVLKKRYTAAQVGAVLVIFTGIAMVVGLGQSVVAPAHQDTTTQALKAAHLPNLAMAIFLCLLGAFCNALLSVITEAALKETLRAEQHRQQQEQQSKLLLSNEYAMWTSFLSFCLLGCFSAVTGDLSRLFSQIKGKSCAHVDNDGGEIVDGTSEAIPPLPTTLFLILCLVSITISRFAERLCKHWICVRDSAMTFSIVQAARRLSGVFVFAALFAEAFTPSMLVGSLVAGTGFVWHTWASLETHTTGGNAAENALLPCKDAEVTKEEVQYEMISLTQLRTEDESTAMHHRISHY